MSLSYIRNIGKVEKQLLKNVSLTTIAFYSRRSNSKSSEPPYKYVKGRLKVDNETQHFEGGPNWELLSPKGNRFFLPSGLGPAWQNNQTTTPVQSECLEELVDFNCKDRKKLWISSKICPIILKKSLVELFPTPEVMGPEQLTIITLMSHSNIEEGAKYFVLAAREICTRLKWNGYWADFMNPFSGKPFYAHANSKKLYNVDERFRGFGMKFEKINECLIISSISGDTAIALDPMLEGPGFSGTIISNIFPDLLQIHDLIGE